ncbi:hypothetical protein LCGC14_2220750 [marine sediment metagenome]|uniref:Uncharacterized protein n=1 Tax=marine sediment metagenome TaxID=412755 RepID=A0A0F9DB71_9ZZZZ
MNSPTEWQVWNFGVILNFVLLGFTVATKNIPGIIVSMIILLIFIKIYKDPLPNKTQAIT